MGTPMIPALDLQAWEDAIPDTGIIVTDGYHVTITVRDGHLVVTDGIPSRKRIRRLPRAKHHVIRIANLGQAGYVTFEAQRWMQASGIAFTSVHEPVRYQDWQAIAGQVRGSADCIRYLIGEKIRGQAENLWLLDQAGPAQRIQDKSKMIENPADVMNAENGAARIYWNTWSKAISIPWKPADARRIPEHWSRFEMRSSRRGNQHATDPMNAILNYGYRIGENACRDACVTTGLSLVHGIIHAPRDDRQAFVFDMLEAIRPRVDRMIIRYLRSVRGFDRRWCHETGTGVVVLDPPLTHRIAGWETELYDKALPVAVECARILRRSHGS